MTTLLVVEDEEKKASNFGFHSSFVFDSYMCFLKITTNGSLVRKRECQVIDDGSFNRMFTPRDFCCIDYTDRIDFV